MALSRITPMEIKEFLDVLDEEIENIQDRKRITQLEVLSQDMVAEKSGNLLILLISNSTRQIRTKIAAMLFEHADDDVIRKHLEFKRALLRGYLTGELNDPEIFSKEHKKILDFHKTVIRKLWAFSEEEKELVRSMLKTA